MSKRIVFKRIPEESEPYQFRAYSVKINGKLIPELRIWNSLSDNYIYPKDYLLQTTLGEHTLLIFEDLKTAKTIISLLDIEALKRREVRGEFE
tara:strand:+ start:2431 stop:2709 length:279 start_codon:yes stop_codon:yes gene_type:complete